MCNSMTNFEQIGKNLQDQMYMIKDEMKNIKNDIGDIQFHIDQIKTDIDSKKSEEIFPMLPWHMLIYFNLIYS